MAPRGPSDRSDRGPIGPDLGVMGPARPPVRGVSRCGPSDRPPGRAPRCVRHAVACRGHDADTCVRHLSGRRRRPAVPATGCGAMKVHLQPTPRIDRFLRTEEVLWLSSVRADGLPHLVPIWFSWDDGVHPAGEQAGRGEDRGHPGRAAGDARAGRRRGGLRRGAHRGRRGAAGRARGDVPARVALDEVRDGPRVDRADARGVPADLLASRCASARPASWAGTAAPRRAPSG